MFNDSPSWILAASLSALVLIVTTLVLVIILAPYIGKAFAKGVSTVRRHELDDLNVKILESTDILRQAEQITATAAEFVADPNLALHTRKALGAIRSAQLQHQYKSLLQGLIATQKRLAEVRKAEAENSSYYASMFAQDAVRLSQMIEDQQQQVKELEPLLDEWGVEYTRITQLQPE